jgi:hypothetical protein
LSGSQFEERAETKLKYMVIEMFKPGSEKKVYARHEAKGRMLPDGLKYIDSWLTEDGKRCFQLMETDHPELFNLWIEKWSDLVEFEIIPVFDSPARAHNIRIQQTTTRTPDD